MHRLDPNPTWNVMDFRAMAEKRRQKAILDAEWQRQHALLARPSSFTLRLAAAQAHLSLTACPAYGSDILTISLSRTWH
jgi:hypothetical protein